MFDEALELCNFSFYSVFPPPVYSSLLRSDALLCTQLSNNLCLLYGERNLHARTNQGVKITILKTFIQAKTYELAFIALKIRRLLYFESIIIVYILLSLNINSKDINIRTI